METEQRVVLADGRTLACVTLGDPSGLPVLYCHGFPGSRLECHLAAEAATRLGLWLIAPDRPGFGRSSFATRGGISAWTADVAALADHLGVERFSVIGVSGGGPYALACAARIPERVRDVTLVAALGPLAPEPVPTEMPAANRLALAIGAETPLIARWGVALAIPWVRRYPAHYLVGMPAAVSPAVRSVIADPVRWPLIEANLREALRQGARGVARELTLLARPWDFALHEARRPVRIWHGLADRIVPAVMARRIAAELPDAEARYFPGEGHLSFIVRRFEDVLASLRA